MQSSILMQNLSLNNILCKEKQKTNQHVNWGRLQITHAQFTVAPASIDMLICLFFFSFHKYYLFKPKILREYGWLHDLYILIIVGNFHALLDVIFIQGSTGTPKEVGALDILS